MLEGQVLRADAGGVEGWVRDAAAPGQAVIIEIRARGRALGRIAAANALPAAPGGGGHGFTLSPVRPLLKGASTRFHLVDARSGLDIPGSPFSIADPARAPTENGLAEIVADAVAGAQMPEELDDLLERLGEARLGLRKLRGRLAREHGRVRPSLLFVDDRVPGLDGGSVVAMAHMRSFRRLGFRVVFLALQPGEAAAMARLEAAGIACPQRYARLPAEALIGLLRPAPGVIYLHKFPAARALLPMLRLGQLEARIIYSVGDLHFLRQEREAALASAAGERAPLLAAAAAQKRDELALMGLADAVLVHSSVEAGLLREMQPRLEVAVVPWAMRCVAPPPFAERAGYAFVGGFDHAPNGDAVHWLAEDIVPLLRPGPVGHVYGSAMPAEIAALARRGLRLNGQVGDVVAALQRHRASVAPLRFGAGVKVKVLMSLACGVPCVMTPVAAEGLDLPEGLNGLVQDTAEGLAGILRRLCRDLGWNLVLSGLGRSFVRKRFSYLAADGVLQDLVVSNFLRK